MLLFRFNKQNYLIIGWSSFQVEIFEVSRKSKLTPVEGLSDVIGKMKFFEGNMITLKNGLYLLMMGESGRISLFFIDTEKPLALVPIFKHDICELLVSGYLYRE